jgi:hypothetical protein
VRIEESETKENGRKGNLFVITNGHVDTLLMVKFYTKHTAYQPSTPADDATALEEAFTLRNDMVQVVTIESQEKVIL